MFKTDVFYINIVLLILLYFICIIFTIVIRNLMIIFNIENISTDTKLVVKSFCILYIHLCTVFTFFFSVTTTSYLNRK